MTEVFKTCVDLSDPLLKNAALKSLFRAAFVDRLMVVENEDARRIDRLGFQFDLIIFDAPEEPVDVLSRSFRLLDRFPAASLIYVNKRCVRHTSLPLINLTKEAFQAIFPQLLSLCYIAHLLQHSSCDETGRSARCA